MYAFTLSASSLVNNTPSLICVPLPYSAFTSTSMRSKYTASASTANVRDKDAPSPSYVMTSVLLPGCSSPPEIAAAYSDGASSFSVPLL